MILSTSFLILLDGIGKPQNFKSPYCRTVAKWIWEYYSFSKSAPGSAIQDIYVRNREQVETEEDNGLIAEFLSSISKEHQTKPNVQYTYKHALEYFKLRSLENLAEEIRGAIISKDYAAGERLVTEYRRIEKVHGEGVSVLENSAAIASAFMRENETLFSFPGALGQLCGNFHRGDFLAFSGPPKRGKSWHLLYTAYRAALTGHRALFFSLEMNEAPVLRRLWKMFQGKPEKTMKLKIPRFASDGGQYGIFYNEKEIKAFDAQEIPNEQKKYRAAVRGGDLRVITFPSFSASVRDIENRIANLEYYDGWIPDIIIIDYADILKPIDTRIDYRHQLDQSWKALRGLAQEKECMVVTASQAGRSTFRRDVGAEDVAEDYRKLAHVTHLLTLNQTDVEKQAGVMRVTSALQREGKDIGDQVIVLQSLEIGRPYLDSMLRGNVNMSAFETQKEKG